MRRVLIIAYYFPPIGGIGSIRLAGLGNHLPEFGWEPTVVAPGKTPHVHDPSLSFPEENVVRSRSLELSRLASPLRRGGGEGTGPGGSASAGLRAFGRRIVFPDAQVGWYPGAVVAGRRALRRQGFDAVYSSSFPISAHFVARTLSRRARLPWVAEFRDPWSDRLPAGHPHSRRAARVESALARRATRVVMPTPTWAAHLGARWKTDIAVVPNGHEISGGPGPPPEAPVLTHVGSFYPGQQSLRALWQGLQQLTSEASTLAPRVRFVGDLHAETRAEAAAHGVGELVETTGQVSHDDAVRLLQSSSMLFAGGQAGNDPIARGWIPAKLFEYLASGLPILYLGDRTSDAGAMLSGVPGCHVVEPDDVEGVIVALRAGLEGQRHDRDSERFSRRSAAATLAAILDDAAEASG